MPVRNTESTPSSVALFVPLPAPSSLSPSLLPPSLPLIHPPPSFHPPSIPSPPFLSRPPSVTPTAVSQKWPCADFCVELSSDLLTTAGHFPEGEPQGVKQPLPLATGGNQMIECGGHEQGPSRALGSSRGSVGCSDPRASARAAAAAADVSASCWLLNQIGIRGQGA